MNRIEVCIGFPDNEAENISIKKDGRYCAHLQQNAIKRNCAHLQQNAIKRKGDKWVSCTESEIKPNSQGWISYKQCSLLNYAFEYLIDCEGKNAKTIVNLINAIADDYKYCSLDLLEYLKTYYMYDTLGNLTTDVENLEVINAYEQTADKNTFDNILKRNQVDSLYHKFESDSMTDVCVMICYSTLHHVFKHEKPLKKCLNCGRYFIPIHKNTKYCNDSPNGENCKDVSMRDGVAKSQEKETYKLNKLIMDRFRTNIKTAQKAGLQNEVKRLERFKDEYVEGLKDLKSSRHKDERKILNYIKTWDDSPKTRKRKG